MTTRILLAVLLAFLASPVLAAWPDSGWYWNPNESGRGVAIEIQDDKVFAAIFTYEQSGSPTFYFASGRMSGDRSFTETLYRSANGQCMGCPYRAPGATAVGSITIHFGTDESATLTALGTTLSLQRFDFSSTNYFNPGALYGEWSTTEGDPRIPTYFGDRITLNVQHTDSGNLFARGYRTGNTARLALGRCESRDLCVMALSFSTTSDEYYTFTMDGFNRMEGLLQIVPAGRTPTAGAGFYFVAHRTKTGAFVRNGVGPAVSKAVASDDVLDAISDAKARHAQAAGKAAIADRYVGEAAERLVREVAAQLAAAKEVLR